MKKQIIKMPYIDYMCKVGERVWWQNIRKEKFEGIIMEWKEDEIAVVKLDDGTEMEVKC